jgi:hypothetical protein
MIFTISACLEVLPTVKDSCTGIEYLDEELREDRFTK